jgi:hypothetical protein
MSIVYFLDIYSDTVLGNCIFNDEANELVSKA